MIKANRHWSASSVKLVCMEYDFYTFGDTCEDYIRMLDMVSNLPPTTENIHLIAKNIAKHSDLSDYRDGENPIANIMHLLENEAVTTTFEIDGED